jgi:hypothetical protein
VGGSRVHAEFRVLEYRWSFGGGEPLVTRGPGSPGLESEVRTTFARRGFYRVGVTVMWAAEAYLDGRRVGEVDDLVSRGGDDLSGGGVEDGADGLGGLHRLAWLGWAGGGSIKLAVFGALAWSG